MSQPPPDSSGYSSPDDDPNRPPYGNQPGYGQPGYGQPPYGPPEYGQSQYGPPEYGQPPYGQPQHGPGSYGQQTPSQPYDQQVPPGYPPQPGYPQQGYYPPSAQGQPGYPPNGLAPVSQSDENLWGVLSHISIPFFGFLGPLIVYLVYKDRSPWLKETAVEALNFSILYTIAQVVSSVLVAVLIGAILLPLVFVGGLVLCILAAVAANRHELYRYPLNWRLIK